MSDGLIIPWREYFPAAVNDADTPRCLFSSATATGPAAALVPGLSTNILVGLQFTDAADLYAEFLHRMPSDWYVPGGLAARYIWCTPATTGNVEWSAYTSFLVDDLDLTFNAGTFVVTPAAASALQRIESLFASLDLTGAEPGALFHLFVERTPGHVDDTMADDAYLLGVELSYQRRIVLP